MNVPCPSLLLLLGVIELLLGTSTELLLGVSALELLLGNWLLELGAIELLLGAMLLELGIAELLLGAADTVTLPHCATMPEQEPVPPLLTLTAMLPALVGVRFAGVHVRLPVTELPLHCTVGAANCTPTVPVDTKPVQVKLFATFTVPHCATIPAQAEPAPVAVPLLTLIATVPAVVGMRPVGVQVRLLVTAVPLQCTVGAVIAVPTVPVVTKPVQVNVFALLELGVTELLLGCWLLELGAIELLLGVTELLLVPPLVPTLKDIVFAEVLMLLISVILMVDKAPS
jgi:hypothetical protein